MVNSMEKCSELEDVLYEFIRNDGDIYREKTTPILTMMERHLKEKTYETPSFVLMFEQLACSDKIVKKLAAVLKEENDGNEKDSKFYRENRFWIGTHTAPFLEEYYRTELCLHLKLGVISSRHCSACNKGLTLEQANESQGKVWCSDKCYEVVWGLIPCCICGKKNMTCTTNAKTPYIHGAALEQACDQCLQKKYGVSIVTISM